MTISIEELRQAAESGAVHTVRVSFSDRLGNWRGKRVPVHEFLASLVGPNAGPVGFCDGMLVCDVICDIIEATPFSNLETGYPDFHCFLNESEIRPVGWAGGEVFVFGQAQSLYHEPVAVYPMNVLRAVADRLAAMGLHAKAGGTLTGRLMTSPQDVVRVDQWPDGSAWGLLGQAAEGLVATGIDVASLARGREDGVFRLSLVPVDPVRAGADLMVAKNALRELASRGGMTATFMTIPPGRREPATLSLDLTMDGLGPVDSSRFASLLDDARPLLQPSVNAYKAGRAVAPEASGGSGGTPSLIEGVVASAEAEPQIAVAIALAAAVEAATGADSAGPGTTDWITADAHALARAHWLERWLGRDFIENSIPLAAREGELLLGAVTDLEVNRYWAFA